MSEIAAETAAIKHVYSALNRNDIPALLQVFDPGIEWSEPDNYPVDGTWRGHSEVLAHFAKGRATWAEGSCEPEEFVAAGDRVVVFVHVRVRLEGHTEWAEGDVGDVFTFRGGKIVAGRSFHDRKKALEWARS